MTSRATNAGNEPLVGSNDLPRFPIVWVGILIAAALLIVAGSFIWAASKSDSLSLARQSDTIDHAIEQQGAAFARELRVQTVWSEGYEKSKAPDLAWMHDFYGAYLTNLLGYEGIYVLNGSDRPVYSYQNGEDVGPAALDAIMPAISDLVAKLRRPDAGKSVRYNLIETPLTLGGRAVTHRAIADIRNILGKPAIVVVSTILPDVYPPDGIISPPFLLVAIYRAEAGFISRLGATFGFDGLRWLDGAADVATSTKVVRSSLGSTVGVLGWKRDEPGGQFFRRVIAGLLTALLLLLSLAALLIRIGKKQMERIVANAAEARLLGRIAAEAQHLARTDVLTGLPNRLALDEALSGFAGDQTIPATVLFMDLDGFKEINDCHGHAIGDQLIVAFAGFLKKLLPEGAILARIGGDEFAVVLPGDQKESAARSLAEKVLGFVAEPFEIDQRILPIGVSSELRREMQRLGRVANYYAGLIWPCMPQRRGARHAMSSLIQKWIYLARRGKRLPMISVKLSTKTSST
jgi:diguanylate cyclase (GGDEF)-like protein